MGKGAGNVCGAAAPKDDVKTGQTSQPAAVKSAKVEEAPKPAQAAVAQAASDKTVKIYIIFYSMYGHIEKLARALKEGIETVTGVQGVLFQVIESLPAEVLQKMYAPPKPADIPVVDVHTITEADGFAFGFPTRFGMMAEQMKAFFDSTGQHWQKGTLHGKPAGLFTSTGGQHGGQEVTLFTAISQLAAHGMVYVPQGKNASAIFSSLLEEVAGGSALGAGTIAGPTGARQPSESELKIAKLQGAYLAEVTKKLKA